MDHRTLPLIQQEREQNLIYQAHMSPRSTSASVIVETSERRNDINNTSVNSDSFPSSSCFASEQSNLPKSVSECSLGTMEQASMTAHIDRSGLDVLQFVASTGSDPLTQVNAPHQNGILPISQPFLARIEPQFSSSPPAAVSSTKACERLQRSRERNRMHARKTRQRKKEHMQTLHSRAEELKQEQLRLRQVINEKNTANILVGLFSVGSASNGGDTEDPEIEKLLRRSVAEIPDASKIPELPALILPGQHHSKKSKSSNSAAKDDSSSTHTQESFPNDGIDYQLLGKDRAKCSPAELDQIRRERNRMHAKRTRDRKRIFMEEMEEMIKQMEDENEMLQEHLNSLCGESKSSQTSNPSDSKCSPELTPSTVIPTTVPPDPVAVESSTEVSTTQEERESPEQRQQLVNQLKSLLVAAGAFQEPQNASNVTDDSSTDSVRSPKRQRLSIPQSITTSTSSAVRV